MRTTQRKESYKKPEMREMRIGWERSFLDSLTTPDIGDWKEDPEPEIEF